MRRRSALIGVAVALSLAAACGSGGSNATVSIKTLQAAVRSSQEAQSTSVEMTVSVDAKGKRVDLHGSGVQTADGKQAQLTIDVNDSGSIEERVTLDGLYMDFGGISRLAAELPDGKRWVFFSYDAMQAQTGTDLRALVDQSRSTNPQQGLAYLEATSGDVTKVGDDTVGGAHATQYRATIDYAKYADEKLADAKPELRDKIAALGKVPADVWINDSDRVVKTHFAIDASAFGAPSGTAELTLEITGFDVPVHVEAPPADETIDIGALSAAAS